MSTAALRGVVRGLALDGPATDAALVTRYAKLNDHGAFAELLRRHGPVVLGVCRRTLGHADADDAFQAVFLVLARKAGCVRPPGSVGGWLYGVAVRVSKKAKVAAARRWRREMATVANPERERGGTSPVEQADLRAVIDAELARLPDKFRLPVVLCDLGGKTRSEAARELGLPDGTVAARLHQARKLLAVRLGRRGVALPVAGLAVLAAAEPVSADLARATLAAAGAFARGGASPVMSTTAQSLAEGVVRAMNAGTWKVGLGMVLAAGLLAGGGLMWAANGPPATAGKGNEGSPAKAEAAVTTDAPGYVADVSFSPEGTRYAVVAGGKVTVHDAATGKVRWAAPGEAARFVAGPKVEGTGPGGERVELPPVQQYVAVLGKDGYVYRRAASGEIVFVLSGLKVDAGWHRVRFDRDGERYAAHTGFGVRVYAAHPVAPPVEPKDQHQPGGGASLPPAGRDVFFSPDGKQVVGVGVLIEPGRVGIAAWRADTGERVQALAEYAPGGGPTAAAYSPDGKTFAAAYTDHIALWPEAAVASPGDGPDLRPRRSPKQVKPAGVPTAVAYSPDGKLLAVGVRRDVSEPAIPNRPDLVVPYIVTGHATEVQLLDAATGKEVRRLTGFGKLPVTALAFSPDGKQLAAGTGLHPAIQELATENPKAGEAKVFALAPEAAPPEQPKADERPAIVERNQDLWAWQDGRPKADGPVPSVAVAPDGKTFAHVGAGGGVVLRDTATRQVVWQFVTGDQPATAVAFSPDGRLVAAARPDGVSLLDAATGTLRRHNPADLGPGPAAVAFGTPAVREVWLGRKAGELKVYRLAVTTGRGVTAFTWINEVEKPGAATFGPLADAPKVDQPHAGVAYSPDGKRLVFIPNNKIDPTWPGNGADRPDPAKATHWYAQVWGGGSGEPMQMLAHGPDPVTALAWSPDGRILTADDKGTVVVWVEAVSLPGAAAPGGDRAYREAKRVKMSGPVTALAFRSDGKRFAAGVRVPPAAGGEKGITQIEVKTEQEGSNPDNWLTSSTLGLQPDEVVRSLAFSPDGLVMIAGTATVDGKGGGLRVWDRRKLAPKDGDEAKPAPAAEPPQPVKPADPPAAANWTEKPLAGFAGAASSVGFAPDGKSFLTGGFGRLDGGDKDRGCAIKWDAATARPLWTREYDDPVTAAVYEPNERAVAVFRAGQMAFLAEGDGKTQAVIKGYGSTFAARSADGRLAFGEADTVTLFPSARGEGEVETITVRPKPGGPPVRPAFAWSPDGKRLVCAHQLPSGRWRLRVWSSPEDQPAEKPAADADPIVAEPFNPDPIRTEPPGVGGPIGAAAWSPDGKTIAYATAPEVVLVDGVTYKVKARAKIVSRDGGGTARALAFSPDGKLLAAGVQLDGGRGVHRVLLLDAATGTEVQRLGGRSPVPVAAVAFSPDGKTLAVAHAPPPGDAAKYTADELAAGGVVLWKRGAAR